MKKKAQYLLLLLASITLGSCSPELSPPENQAGRAPVAKVVADEGPEVPQQRTMQNPTVNASGNFSKNAGVSFSRVNVSGPYIALTFDDGPHPSLTPRLLNILKSKNVKATFYLVGKNVDAYPGIVRRAVAEGHELGNHSYTHRLYSKMSMAGMESEITKTNDSIVRAAGVRPRTLRPPYGGMTQKQRTYIHDKYGMPCIIWQVDPLDWKRPGASVVKSRIVNETTSGAIILAHDIHEGTVDAMAGTIDTLLAQGYKFVTVSQLISLGSRSTAAR